MSCLALAPLGGSSGERGYARMIAALQPEAKWRTEQAIIDTDSAGMTFAITLRGTALAVEFPFPGPAARHRYRFAVDRQTKRAWAERIDTRGHVVAGPIRGNATIAFPLNAPDVFRFIADNAGTPSASGSSDAANSSPRAAYDARAYTITDLGRERLAGHVVEHLHFVARGDAATHPLTDIDVDTETGLPRRVRADLAPHGTPELRVRFGFDLTGSARFWLVTDAHVEASVRIAPGVTRSGHVDVHVEDVHLSRALMPSAAKDAARLF